MAVTVLSIFITYMKAILEIMLYISAIFVSYKAIQALNIYIDKNSNNVISYS